MKIEAIFLLFGYSICTAHCGVLIWGPQNMQIPSLKHFSNEDLDELASGFNDPKLVVFRGDPMMISDKLVGLLKNKHTAYIPNSNLNIYGLIELDGSAEDNFNKITTELAKHSSENILALIISASDRAKRDIEDTTDDDKELGDIPESENDNDNEPSGQFLYTGQGSSGKTAMIYTSKPMQLKMNSTTLLLGKGYGSYDLRPHQVRFTVNYPMRDKLMLIFKFQLYDNGYWSLTSLEIIEVQNNSKRYTLSLMQDATAPAKFSYHCSGESVFTNDTNEIELTLYDMQAQPDAASARFDSAYDCVNFTTAPIWSGLFVTSILLIVLGLGLGALNSIKTMDKFDNYKTKQLTITTSE